MPIAMGLVLERLASLYGNQDILVLSERCRCCLVGGIGKCALLAIRLWA